jgi:prepilin-type N-terminal cleavage/methylation domain-containing protein
MLMNTQLNSIRSRAPVEQLGFTLVEALVAMAIFMIGFSGLYVFFNFSQQSVMESERRMYLNLMGDRIIQTIAAESQRNASDSLNPFTTPSTYGGSLNACVYSDADIRQEWCKDLNTNVGAYNAISGKENRHVELINDGTGLIVNVSLIIADGKVSAYFTRKLRQL